MVWGIDWTQISAQYLYMHLSEDGLTWLDTIFLLCTTLFHHFICNTLWPSCEASWISLKERLDVINDALDSIIHSNKWWLKKEHFSTFLHIYLFTCTYLCINSNLFDKTQLWGDDCACFRLLLIWEYSSWSKTWTSSLKKLWQLKTLKMTWDRKVK